MDTALLRTFVEVTRAHNFSKAAENLCVTPAAVSVRIRQLEESLGVTLFVRHHRSVSITPAGERLLRHVNGILNAWERAFEDVALSGRQRKSLVVAGVTSLWDIFLQQWLNRIHLEMPEIGLRVEASTAKRVAQKLERGQIDLGFLFEPPKLPELVLHEVQSMPLIMVSSTPGIGAEQALAENYIMVDWGMAFSSQHARHFPLRPVAAVRVNSGRIARSLLEACGGSAYLPWPEVRDQLAQRRLYPVADAPEIPMKAYAAYPAHDEHRELIEQLLRFFTAEPSYGAAGLSDSGSPATTSVTRSQQQAKS